MAYLPFIIWAIIMCHCCLLSIFGIERYKPGTIPYSDPVMCSYEYSPVLAYSYCCCMVMTIMLLIYLFKFIITDEDDY